MNDKSLMRWGGLSAFAFVVLFTISIAAFWVTGGLEFRAWVPLFSSVVCFWFIASIAAYDYLKTAEYALARIGFGFALMSVIILFLEAVVWGADRIVLRIAPSNPQSEVTELGALFASLHHAVLWFIGIWYALWGIAFFRMKGKAKIVGAAMLLIAGLNIGDYLFVRMSETGLLVEAWHLGGQVSNLVAYSFLGLLLLEESRRKEN
jgi:hypothetical protein